MAVCQTVRLWWTDANMKKKKHRRPEEEVNLPGATRDLGWVWEHFWSHSHIIK